MWFYLYSSLAQFSVQFTYPWSCSYEILWEDGKYISSCRSTCTSCTCAAPAVCILWSVGSGAFTVSQCRATQVWNKNWWMLTNYWKWPNLCYMNWFSCTEFCLIHHYDNLFRLKLILSENLLWMLRAEWLLKLAKEAESELQNLFIYLFIIHSFNHCLKGQIPLRSIFKGGLYVFNLE